MFIRTLLSIQKTSTLNVSFVGGSNSVMRRGYAKYLSSYLSKLADRPIAAKYYSLGGVPSIHGVIQQHRHDIAANSNIIFFEYCVNDRHAIEENQYSLGLAEKSLEGFIRAAKESNPECLIIILIFGVNHDSFYDNCCHLSQLYQSVGKYYGLPVIDVTKTLRQAYGLDYIKSLYDDQDVAHYTRPYGVQVVAGIIARELSQRRILDDLKISRRAIAASKRALNKSLAIAPLDPDNFADLAFFEQFHTGKYFHSQPKISVYQNSVFREKNFTIYQGNSLNFLLKGKLMAILIKSDLNDGFITIAFGQQCLVTSSYSPWVNAIRPQNVIDLITLPLRRFVASSDFAPVSISLCSEYPQNFELGFNKIVPRKKEPQKWKLSIVGIAYRGELKAMN